MLGYRFHTNYEWGMAFFQPSAHAATFARVIAEVRQERPELDDAIRGLESLTPDVNDHSGFIVKSEEEWEARLAAFEAASAGHPEWQVTVTGVLRPNDPEALTDRLAQAWIRIGLLGPIRNTFEMQYLNPASRSAEEIEAGGGTSATPRDELLTAGGASLRRCASCDRPSSDRAAGACTTFRWGAAAARLRNRRNADI
jgi:hypothetical protein